MGCFGRNRIRRSESWWELCLRKAGLAEDVVRLREASWRADTVPAPAPAPPRPLLSPPRNKVWSCGSSFLIALNFLITWGDDIICRKWECRYWIHVQNNGCEEWDNSLVSQRLNIKTTDPHWESIEANTHGILRDPLRVVFDFQLSSELWFSRWTLVPFPLCTLETTFCALLFSSPVWEGAREGVAYFLLSYLCFPNIQ